MIFKTVLHSRLKHNSRSMSRSWSRSWSRSAFKHFYWSRCGNRSMADSENWSRSLYDSWSNNSLFNGDL